MHSFLRAVGFDQITRKTEEDKLIKEMIETSHQIEISEDSNGNDFVELTNTTADSMGIKLCGEYAEDGTFQLDYYFPYFEGTAITTEEEVEIEKHSEKESYAGVCDEMKLGVTLIFYLLNVPQYLSESARRVKKIPLSAALSALSLNGKILMPINKNEKQASQDKKISKDHNHMIAAAREGDEDAIENLTLEDIDMYTMLSRRIVNEDVLSIVNTYFMPYGIESDQYSILAEILDFKLVTNAVTNAEIYVMNVRCNDLIYDVCINKKDLLGEPAVGRRFKGSIWMQGKINYE